MASMDLSIEDELQATVEKLRKSEEENFVHQQQLKCISDKLCGKDKEIEKSKNYIDIYNKEVVCLQEELHLKSEELEQVKIKLTNQRESIVNYRQYFSVLKHNRWRLMAALMSTRKLIAMSLERVRQIETTVPSDAHNKSHALCSPAESIGTSRVPTPTLPSCNSSSSSQSSRESEDDEDDLRVSGNYNQQLRKRIKFLESQLLELGEEKQKEQSALNDVIQSLEEEIGILRDEDSRHALLEQRLIDALQLLRSVLSLNLSRRTIGNLVVEAMEDSVNPSTKEVSPLRFLTHLQRGIMEYERSSTEGLIRLALQAV